MPNFYLDNLDILFHMKNMDLSRIVKLKENDFLESKIYPEAPDDLENALDNYHRVLTVAGEIAGEFIAPRASEVDKKGATFKNGEVSLAKGSQEALERLKQSDFLGFSVPRKYEGLNMPKIIYGIAIELISRADASLMNLFGLQEIAETIYRYGTSEQKNKYLSRFCRGEVKGAMALTEPDAGSDLQSVMLKARLKDDGNWYLNGVKRFITNGYAEVSLVMARSEEGTKDGRGISLFIYERDKNLKIRRIEKKLGIKGSPTCELQFNNAKAELLGKRRMGLIKYTMSLMNGARLGVSAQAVGIAEAAFQEANSYAKKRKQFNKKIIRFTAVYEMLTHMKISIEAGRSLLYEASRVVDIKEGLEDKITHYPELKSKYNKELKYYTKLAYFLTPLCKYYTTEMANKVCYDAIQVHGGVGFTTEFNVERHYRDVRITNIYEGTTQLQVVAAINGIVSGLVFYRLDEYEKAHDFKVLSELFHTATKLRTSLDKAISFVKEQKDQVSLEFHAQRLVSIASYTVISYLLCIDALKCDRKKKVASIFIAKAAYKVESTLDHILSGDINVSKFHESILD